jgi:hypothetical protein
MKYPIAFSLVVILTCLIFNLGSPSDSYLFSRTVKLVKGKGSCSGEQIRTPSGGDYILTAAHCRILMDDSGSFEVITEDGRHLNRRLVGEDSKSDLLLLEGIPNMKGISVAAVAPMKTEIRTFTHGGGLDAYKTSGVLVQYVPIQVPLHEIESEKDQAYCDSMPSKYYSVQSGWSQYCVLNAVETATTAFIIPGSSGGMVVDSSGELVGVVSALGGGFGWLVTLTHINEFVKNY